MRDQAFKEIREVILHRAERGEMLKSVMRELFSIMRDEVSPSGWQFDLGQLEGSFRAEALAAVDRVEQMYEAMCRRTEG